MSCHKFSEILRGLIFLDGTNLGLAWGIKFVCVRFTWTKIYVCQFFSGVKLIFVICSIHVTGVASKISWSFC